MHEILIRALSRAAFALAALFVVTSLAFAQVEPKKSPFGVGPAPTAAAGTEVTGASGAWGWLMATQKYYQDGMSKSVRDLKTDHQMAAAASLAFISFMYGVLHAAGPGHGKAVISSYVLANRQTMRRGIFLSFLAAFFQACSAILLVGILALAIKATSLQMKAAETWIETLSWALVAGVGVWLLYRQVAPLLAKPAAAHDHAHHHAPAVAHVHGPGCNHGDDHHDHLHDDHAHSAQDAAHVHDEHCGHVHMPEPSQLEGPWVWSKAISLAMTVGIRPCTGAILVMLFALSQGLLWAGIFATFMMSFGTALTVSALAALAVGSRDLAVRWAGTESPWAGRLETLVGIGGAVVVILLGSVGFFASLHGPAPF